MSDRSTTTTPPTTTTTTTKQEEEASDLSEKKEAVINGRGLWDSFTRNFRSPLLAVLDLFDNAVDATLQQQPDKDDNVGSFQGCIDIYPDNDERGSICMRNNCAQEIPPLHKVLEVFGSQKGATEIGENGVGVKQACAAISDLSIIITKNPGNVFQIGFIAKALQTNEGCCLPSYDIDVTTTTEIHDELVAARHNCSHFRQVIEEYNKNNDNNNKKKNGLLSRIERHMVALKEDTLHDTIFLVIMHNIHQRGVNGGVKGLLQSLRTELPRQYLHIPPHFKVTIDGKVCQFQYWERRLMELHHFSLNAIDANHSYKVAFDWDKSPDNNNDDDDDTSGGVKLFLGFDFTRQSPNNKAMLLVYSRKSGRLVKETMDARGDLGLCNSGTDFSQGLTIIVDDRQGTLPITPTKQDLAFGREPNGQIHRMNLYAFVGAYTKFYYNHFKERVGGKKGDLSEVVSSQTTHIHVDSGLTLQNHQYFSTFQGLMLTRKEHIGPIRCSRPRNMRNYEWDQRAGTRVRINRRQASITPRRRRKATPVRHSTTAAAAVAPPNVASVPTAAEVIVIDDDDDDDDDDDPDYAPNDHYYRLKDDMSEDYAPRVTPTKRTAASAKRPPAPPKVASMPKRIKIEPGEEENDYYNANNDDDDDPEYSPFARGRVKEDDMMDDHRLEDESMMEDDPAAFDGTLAVQLEREKERIAELEDELTLYQPLVDSVRQIEEDLKDVQSAIETLKTTAQGLGVEKEAVVAQIEEHKEADRLQQEEMAAACTAACDAFQRARGNGNGGAAKGK